MCRVVQRNGLAGQALLHCATHNMPALTSTLCLMGFEQSLLDMSEILKTMAKNLEMLVERIGDEHVVRRSASSGSGSPPRPRQDA